MHTLGALGIVFVDQQFVHRHGFLIGGHGSGFLLNLGDHLVDHVDLAGLFRKTLYPVEWKELYLSVLHIYRIDPVYALLAGNAVSDLDNLVAIGIQVSFGEFCEAGVGQCAAARNLLDSNHCRLKCTKTLRRKFEFALTLWSQHILGDDIYDIKAGIVEVIGAEHHYLHHIPGGEGRSHFRGCQCRGGAGGKGEGGRGGQGKSDHAGNSFDEGCNQFGNWMRFK